MIDPFKSSNMKLMKLASIAIVLLFIQACSHPIAIEGQGDVTTSLNGTGTRGCSFEQATAVPVPDNCAKNLVIGPYQETYSATARPGWKFKGWVNYCTDVIAPPYNCSFNVPAAAVQKYWWKTMPPLKAVFTPVTVNTKPNILLIMADDLGYNDLAINNDNTAIDTPNMDQIARDGVRFTRHYAHGVCSPARASLLTGFYPERLGYLPNGRGISPEVVTLPERLKEEGYTTWHIGKWHIGDVDRTAWPDYQGFDHWFGFLNQWRLAGLQTADGDIVLTAPRYNDPWLDSDSEPGRNYPGHLETILTDKAIAVLSDLNNAQAPWFLNLWYYAPHGPVTPASEFAIKYPNTPAGIYQALVNQLDHNIGQVISHLDTIGALQNTIVVVVSDNGGTNASLDNNYPFYGKKATLHEGGLRTPLLIKWPEESINGQVYSDTVSIADIYPTLLESIGVTPPDNVDGSSFYQGVQQAELPPQKALFWELYPENYGVLSADGRWRLHQFYRIWGVLPAPNLFDLLLDDTGTQPVLPTPPLKLAELQGDYQAWYRDVHTVATTYVENANGSGVLNGMGFLRTPGFGTYTFGIGIPDAQEGPIATQAGVWAMSRTGDTVTAHFGDLTLTGDIQNSNSCHSIVVSGNFARQIQSDLDPDSITLSLYIDGVVSQSASLDTTLQVDDFSVETIIGDPESASGAGTLSSPVILNTALSSSSPLTLEAFSQQLCDGN
jgi:arylsulfatase A-like enzyme